jgi:hypothetical protein
MFPSTTLSIDTIKYGIDFRRKCIIGIRRLNNLASNNPFINFDLDSTGIVNGSYNSLMIQSMQSLCIQHLVCPNSHKYQLSSSQICYDCSNSNHFIIYIFIK